MTFETRPDKSLQIKPSAQSVNVKTFTPDPLRCPTCNNNYNCMTLAGCLQLPVSYNMCEVGIWEEAGFTTFFSRLRDTLLSLSNSLVVNSIDQLRAASKFRMDHSWNWETDNMKMLLSPLGKYSNPTQDRTKATLIWPWTCLYFTVITQLVWSTSELSFTNKPALSHNVDYTFIWASVFPSCRHRVYYTL